MLKLKKDHYFLRIILYLFNSKLTNIEHLKLIYESTLEVSKGRLELVFGTDGVTISGV